MLFQVSKHSPLHVHLAHSEAAIAINPYKTGMSCYKNLFVLVKVLKRFLTYHFSILQRCFATLLPVPVYPA